MKKCFAILVACIPALILSSPPSLADCDTVTVHYHVRVPYVEATPIGLAGLTGTPAALAFEKAAIAFQWKQTPSKRQLLTIRRNTGCDCSIGWFKNPERQKFAKFTHHIYQDEPQIALARADDSRLYAGMTVDTALANRQLKLEVKDGYSYGVFLDAKIARHRPKLSRTTGANVRMLKKIHQRRADYMFIAPEEAASLIQLSGFPAADFKFVRFADMSEGEKRYILCSRKVGDDIIEKLNAAIAE